MDRQTYSLWRVGATAMLVDSRTPAAQRQDVIESVLYAQLQTDRQHGTCAADYPVWNRFYRDALVSRGWAAQSREGRYVDLEPLAAEAPLQWLADQVGEQCPSAAQALQVAAASLRQGASEPVGEGSDVHELGILGPDYELLLCGLGIDRRPATTPAHEVPAPAAYLSTWRGVLDEDSYEEMRELVHRNILRKLRTDDLIKDLGALPTGGLDGNA